MGLRLKVLAQQDNAVAEIFLTDQHGGLAAASGKTSDFYQADEAWWQRAYSHGKGDVFVGEVEPDESSGKISIAIAVPIKDESGRVIGIAKAVIDTAVFFKEMEAYKYGRTGHSALIDAKGKVIYHADLKLMSGSPVSEIALEKLLDSKRDFMIMRLGGPEGNSLIAAAKVRSQHLRNNHIDWITVVAQKVSEVLFPMLMIFGASLILAPIICFLLMAVMQNSLRDIFISPLQRVRDGILRFSRGEQNYKIELKTGDEIEDLAVAFNEMTGRLEETTISRDYLGSIMGSMADSLIVVDPDAKIATVNIATCALLGYEEKELIGKDVSLLFSEEEEEEEEEIPLKGTKLKKLFEAGGLKNHKVNYKARDGRKISVMLSGAVLKRICCPQGAPKEDCPSFKEKGEHCEKIMGAVCVAKDITDLMEAEKKLNLALEEEKKSREIVISMLDDNNQIREGLERAKENLEVQVKDRTLELELSNKRLQATAEDLKRASKAKSEFLANMSHELRTPLASIIGFSEVIYDEKFGPLNERQKEYTENVLTSGRHLLSLINDILDLSKVESGKMVLEASLFSVKDCLEEVLRLADGLAFSKKINPVVEIPDDLGEIHADLRKVKQVVFNLMSNAIKFTPAGGKLGLRARRDDSGIEIAVWDTGIGIPPENLENVFEAFTRLVDTYTQETEGTGLGLTISRKIVELHGGKMWIESEGTGKGTTVKCTIPGQGSRGGSWQKKI
jgi:PAS domain S-box-containing protein